jgi:hypothetical protein
MLDLKRLALSLNQQVLPWISCAPIHYVKEQTPLSCREKFHYSSFPVERKNAGVNNESMHMPNLSHPEQIDYPPVVLPHYANSYVI